MKRYDVIIAGGGAIGLWTAWFIQKHGLDVLVIERDRADNGCSWGNAGMIVPSHFIPLAAPGVVAKGLRWMFSAESPFSITPRPDPALMDWLLRFAGHSNSRNVERSARLLLSLNLRSRDLYGTMSSELGYKLHRKGLLIMFTTPHGEREENDTLRKATRLGLEPDYYKGSALRDFEPAVGEEVRGAVHYTSDAHTDPAEMMTALRKKLEGSIIYDPLIRFNTNGNEIISALTAGGEYAAGNFVVAAGVWSGNLLRNLGISLPLVGGKGYSFMVPAHTPLGTPAILSEARVAVTPLGSEIRFGGTMQIGKGLPGFTRGKLRGMAGSIGRYLPSYEMNGRVPEKVWAGLRPLSPDGLPYIGQAGRFSNLFVGTGHAMMGISLAPVTGELLAAAVTQRTMPEGWLQLSPRRFAK